MIYSMTGYASIVIQFGNATIQLEIKSVNHRFLDITLKSSEEFKSIDNLIRGLISQQISRGKIDVRIFFKDAKDGSQQLSLNENLLNEYLKLVNKINSSGNQSLVCSVNDIIAFPGILAQEQYAIEDLQEPIIKSFTEMLRDFKNSQQAEGSKLATILNSKLTEIQSIIKEVYPILKSVSSSYHAKIKQRLNDFLSESDINDARFQQEFAFFCQKIDVTEEIDRLEAHVAEFKSLLAKGGNIGKRLDFICQEMHREANTFGSKSVAIETTRKAVDLKVLIEQIREQIQNIM